MRFRLSLSLLVICATITFLATAARADLKVCNDTDKTIGVAIGYKSEGTWTSEGWWRISGGSCSALIEGQLSSRYYYLHAEDASGQDRWMGRVFMCTSAKKFKIRGLQDCFARGLERTGFFEVDTKDQVNWQVRLSNDAQTDSNPDAESGQAVPPLTN
jgi:uncharacterized membrane protein